ncbi:MAG: PIN domain-containing protein [Deltaproteobacteria bacterium]|nr:PIN domain-containing protein [Deltaproteobacteria bacterium]
MKRRRGLENVPRATRGVTFDTGVLIALERRHAGALALLKACRLSRASITIPATVVAEWWRGDHRALLEAASLEALTPALAERAGELLARTGGDNAIDATVIASAAQRGDIVVTGDGGDLRALARGVPNVEVADLR